jgi:coproporphyrinogen III oxidase
MNLDELMRQVASFFAELQNTICDALERYEHGQSQARFSDDRWQHVAGGGGRSRVLQDGAVFEKAGVNWSFVHGELPAEFAATLPGEGTAFGATGVSLVLHPRNPHVPAFHANFRFLIKGSGPGRQAWFGGGADLTPCYLYREDVVHFHRCWRQVCERHRVADYARFKRWCDEYFYLPHRGEMRGVGGIFFDYLGEQLEEVFAFVRDAGRQILTAYLPIVDRRRHLPYGERERRWQLLRRGRYAEFNLLYDRGTAFGLRSGGRVESILMSLPPLAAWAYNVSPEPDSPEAELVAALQPRDWAEESLDGNSL